MHCEVEYERNLHNNLTEISAARMKNESDYLYRKYRNMTERHWSVWTQHVICKQTYAHGQLFTHVLFSYLVECFGLLVHISSTILQVTWLCTNIVFTLVFMSRYGISVCELGSVAITGIKSLMKVNMLQICNIYVISVYMRRIRHYYRWVYRLFVLR
jgi:hypothetical protein